MVAGLTACGSGASSDGAAASGSEGGSFKTLNVGTMALTCGIPVLYAEEKGYFKDAGLDVNIEIFATGAPINEAIAADQIDIAVSGFASVYSLANANCTWLADVNTTKVNMCDGCFARNKVVEERSEEVQLFVDCLVKAMDELQDDDLRSEYTRKVYDDNAITCTNNDLAHEIEDRDYVGTEAMKADGYKLGEAWVSITDFLVSAEKITADNAPNVAASINPAYVSKTTGIDIKSE